MWTLLTAWLYFGQHVKCCSEACKYCKLCMLLAAWRQCFLLLMLQTACRMHQFNFIWKHQHFQHLYYASKVFELSQDPRVFMKTTTCGGMLTLDLTFYESSVLPLCYWGTTFYKKLCKHSKFCLWCLNSYKLTWTVAMKLMKDSLLP